ncbi:MAG: beta-mannanase [Chloroflexi bacterium]|nr:beta-mannanase [Chloroflexota bacterium]
MYHGAYPGGISGSESNLTIDDLRSYESVSGKSAAWVFFSDNWFESRAFPLETVTWIREAGGIPYIRLMLRSSEEQGIAEPVYFLQAILDGEFDTDLKNWCAEARNFGTSILVEYGTEVNGNWFSWSGVWNGADETAGYGDPNEADGPERFRDAYRHIIDVCQTAGAENITWVFHLNAGDWPQEDWNRFENYYPGDDWIDWIGISFYGAQTPQAEDWEEFRAGMDQVYPRVDALTSGKPIIIAEFGVTKNNPLGDQAEWARAALEDITSFRWPRVIGFSWWNDIWQNDDDPTHDTTMRLQDNPQLSVVFQELVGANEMVLGRIHP